MRIVTIEKTALRKHLLITGLLLLLLGAGVLSAWIEDDAYITYRTIDNFIHGHGLTWNVTERVQTYTHPLWMFLLLPLYALSGEIYYTSIFVSLILTLAAGWLIAYRLAEGTWTAVLALLAMIASKPFIDFSTSGLENPLTHLILALFFVAFFRLEKGRKKVFVLSLLVALAAVNRMDSILLYLPALAYAFFASPGRKNLWPLLLGFAPLAAWMAFAMFYYGSPFPNTAFAKLNAGIAGADLVKQGLLYVECTIKRSPFTALCMVAAVLYALGTRSLKMIFPALGILIYAAYVVRIGGDYMDGRFFSAPFLLGVILLSRHHFRLALTEGTMIASTAVILGLAWPNSPVRVNTDYGKGPELYYWHEGISDERAGYYQYTGLLVQPEGVTPPNHRWVEEGRGLRERGVRVLKTAGIGFLGYFAGPGVHIVDSHALTDPLLSRLPVMTPTKWRIAHFQRPEPTGYLESLDSGENRIADPSLAGYYDKLVLITRGPLFSWSRLRTIWNFNLGRYDHLIDEFNARPRTVALRDFRKPRPRGTIYNAKGCLLIREPGLRVDLEGSHNNPAIELSVDSNDDYFLSFQADTTVLGTHTIPIRRIPEGGLRVDTVTVPQEAVRHGFNFILIQPRGGDDTYSVGHLRLLEGTSSEP